MATTSSKKVTLTSSDGETFEVDEIVALQSQKIKQMIEEDCADNPIPIDNVTGNMLSRVIDYCKKHVEEKDEGKLKAFDATFVDVDMDTLYDLVLAAQYLDVKGLLELMCYKVADIIKGKSPEEIRSAFKLGSSGYTPEEEEEIRERNQWAF